MASIAVPTIGTVGIILIVIGLSYNDGVALIIGIILGVAASLARIAQEFMH
jgi:hypothetical protein